MSQRRSERPGRPPGDPGDQERPPSSAHTDVPVEPRHQSCRGCWGPAPLLGPMLADQGRSHLLWGAGLQEPLPSAPRAWGPRTCWAPAVAEVCGVRVAGPWCLPPLTLGPGAASPPPSRRRFPPAAGSARPLQKATIRRDWGRGSRAGWGPTAPRSPSCAGPSPQGHPPPHPRAERKGRVLIGRPYETSWLCRTLLIMGRWELRPREGRDAPCLGN